ncbi:sulfatase-like hydrolase/transferase [Granulicella tundricola]|uniref:Sulfatase N-terminal domain-containing protein n=1 Tax=Granulicella tundricola (strain ATCC BAA-1859 / DSM 23138 / MP5ACTX9) TaxID=1198114 RepID=E8WZ97_GRATM|nr:sulfatase-like hydrolase/transferase [Granulicella tundricola]ADW67699.1 hypothetical protein AciX9_0628 [Granulicella tundricola MP5ACTX9]
MKSVLRSASLAFALTTLYLLNLTGPLISPEHDLAFHFPAAASILFLPVLIDIALLFLVLTAVLLAAARNRRVQLVVWSILLLPIPAILLSTIASFSGKRVPQPLTLAFAFLPILALLFIAVRLRHLIPRFRRLRPAVESIFAFIAVSGLIIVAELLWFNYQARNNNAPPVLHVSTVSQPAPNRIIWLLLDELSYDQLYEHRYPGLQLPAFDRLAAQSSLLTHVEPANEFTRVAVPSLLTGEILEDTRQSSDGLHLGLKDDETAQWSRLDPANTVFADALAAHYSTSAVGWYEPYCRIFPSVLDHCFWIYGDDIPGGISARRTTSANVVASFQTLGRHVLENLHLGRTSEDQDQALRDVHGHRADYQALLTAGDAALADPSSTFLYLHMPIPHPFGFYDRRTHSFPDHQTSYLDNLALADEYLAHVRQILEKQAQWDNATVIVMGDHSWRTSFVWSVSPHWTPEEDLASHHANYDERPAYLIKLPHQQTPTRIGHRFEASHTRPLIKALLTHQLQTPADLTDWIDSQQ